MSHYRTGVFFPFRSTCVACLESQVLTKNKKQPILEPYFIRAVIEAGSADLKNGSFRDLRNDAEMPGSFFPSDNLQGRNIFPQRDRPFLLAWECSPNLWM